MSRNANDTFSGDRWDNTRVIVVSFALLAAIGAVLFFLSPVLNALLIPFLYRQFLPALGEFTRLNPYAMKVIAGLLTLGAVWLARRMFSGPPSHEDHWLGRYFPRLDGDRVFRGILFFFCVSVIVNFLGWLGTYDENFDPDGEHLRYYIIRSDGSVDLHYEGGLDEISGRPRHPVTPEIWPTLQAYESGAFHRVEDPDDPDVKWYDRIGNPLLFVWRSEDGSEFEFWNGPGAHPVHRDQLVPVSPEIRREWEEWKAENRDAEGGTDDGASVEGGARNDGTSGDSHAGAATGEDEDEEWLALGKAHVDLYDDGSTRSEGFGQREIATGSWESEEADIDIDLEKDRGARDQGGAEKTWNGRKVVSSDEFEKNAEKGQTDLEEAARRAQERHQILAARSEQRRKAQDRAAGTSPAPRSTPTPPAKPDWMSFGIVRNHTGRSIELAYLGFDGRWRNRTVHDGMFRFIAVPESPIRIRWEQYGRLVECELPSKRVRPPFPAPRSLEAKRRAAHSEFYFSREGTLAVRRLSP